MTSHCQQVEININSKIKVMLNLPVLEFSLKKIKTILTRSTVEIVF